MWLDCLDPRSDWNQAGVMRFDPPAVSCIFCKTRCRTPVKLAHALFTCTRSSSCCAMPDVRDLEIRQGPPVNAVSEADSPNQLFPG
jgi:hypothetical protein